MREIATVCRTLRREATTLRKMIIAPGLNPLALDIWSMEIEQADYQPEFNALAVEIPSPAAASLKADATGFALWNLMQMVPSTVSLTWIIQALEAKLMFALVRSCRSVLCIIETSLTKIQQQGLDAGKSRDIQLWKAWNALVELVESRLEILQTAPGGLLQAHERCHNATCSRKMVRGKFRQCVGCLSAQYCQKVCQTHDWKFSGHREFCKELEAQRRGDLDFIDTVIEVERSR